MASNHAPQMCCPIVELRRYTLHPGQRDTLIELFEREFIEPQEAVGIEVIGQFLDLNDPDQFVWLRGFPDMPSRKASLQAFYGGTVWKQHRDAANATMIDSDNVLLLRHAHPAAGFSLGATGRPRRGATDLPPGLIVAVILSFAESLGAGFPEVFEQKLKPALIQCGASIRAAFVTESSENTFPALPVREGEQVFVWFSSFQDPASYQEYQEALARSKAWNETWSVVGHQLNAAPETLLLQSTARSLLRG